MTDTYLGRPTGPRLRELTFWQQEKLDTWLSEALIKPPSKRSPMPVNYTRALSQLAKRRGIVFRFDGVRAHERHGSVPLGKNIPGCVGGSKRVVVVTDTRSEVSKLGRRVEPYNDRPWRDDVL